MMTTTASALDALRAVSANEQFESLREMFPALAVVARALVSDEDFAALAPAEIDLLSNAQLVRVTYLVRLLHGRMAPVPARFWGEWLACHGDVRAPEGKLLTFFHSDAALSDRPCNDDVAVGLGLKQGVDIGKLLQLLRTGRA